MERGREKVLTPGDPRWKLLLGFGLSGLAWAILAGGRSCRRKARSVANWALKFTGTNDHAQLMRRFAPHVLHLERNRRTGSFGYGRWTEFQVVN
jgi:hypothetical protein